MKNRDRTSIHATILTVCLSRPLRVTDILYATKLYGGAYMRYIRFLAEAGLLAKDGKKYATTVKGKEWLSHYQAMKELEGKQR